MKKVAKAKVKVIVLRDQGNQIVVAVVVAVMERRVEVVLAKAKRSHPQK